VQTGTTLRSSSALQRERRALHTTVLVQQCRGAHARYETGTRVKAGGGIRVTISAGAAWGGTHSPADAREVM
jgi:hypothetical protein